MEESNEKAEEGKGQTRERIILAAPRYALSGFLDFVRERGVVGLAIGFVLATSVQKVVTAFVGDIVNPFIGLVFFGKVQDLTQYSVGSFKIGDFLSVLIDFFFLLAIIYLVFRALGLDKLEKPKS
jgi:large conductance mechanosensitive channel